MKSILLGLSITFGIIGGFTSSTFMILYFIGKRLPKNTIPIDKLLEAFNEYYNRIMKFEIYEQFRLVEYIIDNLNNDIRVKEIELFEINKEVNIEQFQGENISKRVAVYKIEGLKTKNK